MPHLASITHLCFGAGPDLARKINAYQSTMSNTFDADCADLPASPTVKAKMTRPPLDAYLETNSKISLALAKASPDVKTKRMARPFRIDLA
jgi:hypothetical protein